MAAILPEQNPAASRVSDRFFAAALIACAAIALATRWFFLSAESLWFDEGWTWWLVTQPAGDILRLIRADLVAPAYFYLLHGWVLIFGDDIGAMRGLSALLVTLALVPWAVLARRLLISRLSLLVGSALAAISFMQSQYAREARPYALLTLFVIGALASVPALAARRSWPAMLGFVLCVTGGMYTHNVMPFYAASLATAWLVWPGERTLRGRVLDISIVTAACIAAYLPWVPILREQTRWLTGNFWVSRPSLSDAAMTTSTVCGVDVYAVSPMLWRTLGNSPDVTTIAAFILIAAGLAAVLGLVTRDVAAGRRALAVAIVAFAPMLAVFAYSRVNQPIFLGRLFAPSSLLVPLILAMAMDRGRSRGVRGIVAVIAGSFAILGVASTAALLTMPQKEDWRGIHAYVASLPPSDRRLIVFMSAEGELPFKYYVENATPAAKDPRTGTPAGFFDNDPPRTIQRVRSEADLEPLRRALESGLYDEVVLVLSHQTYVDPDGLTRKWLERRGTTTDEVKLRNVRALRVRIEPQTDGSRTAPR